MTDRHELIQDLGDLGQIPQDDDGPTFSAPWEAAAFALAVRLSQEGHFTWAEWTETLTQEIAEAQRRGDPDHGSFSAITSGQTSGLACGCHWLA